MACLAFDATRASVVDVELPIGVVVMGERERRISAPNRRRSPPLTGWRSSSLEALAALPLEWAAGLLPTP